MLATRFDQLPNMNGDAIPRLAVYISILVFAALIALLGFQFFQALSFAPDVQPQPASPVRADKKTYRITDITRSNLFGEAAPNQNPGAYDNLPKTQVRLTLRGAFTATDPAQASAIIESADKQSRSYKVNSRIQGNIQLKAVYRDRVVLSRGSRLETLYFPEPSSDFSEAEADTPAATTTAETTTQAVTTNTTAISKPANQLTNEQKNQLIRQRLQELRERARSSRTK